MHLGFKAIVDEECASSTDVKIIRLDRAIENNNIVNLKFFAA